METPDTGVNTRSAAWIASIRACMAAASAYLNQFVFVVGKE